MAISWIDDFHNNFHVCLDLFSESNDCSVTREGLFADFSSATNAQNNSPTYRECMKISLRFGDNNWVNALTIIGDKSTFRRYIWTSLWSFDVHCTVIGRFPFIQLQVWIHQIAQLRISYLYLFYPAGRIAYSLANLIVKLYSWKCVKYICVIIYHILLVQPELQEIWRGKKLL